MTDDAPDLDLDDLHAALRAWMAATGRVIAETLRLWLEAPAASAEVRAEPIRREYMAWAARIADALDDDDEWTRNTIADHCRVLSMTLEMAADALAPDASPLDQ